MDQGEDHHQTTEVLGSFRRLRERRKRLSAAQDCDGDKSSLWNEGTCSSEKQLWVKRRSPLLQIRDENSRVLEGTGVVDAQPARQQYSPPSHSSFKKSHHRRSCAPRLMNTGSSSSWGASAAASGGGGGALACGDYKSAGPTSMHFSLTKPSRNKEVNSENAPMDILPFEGFVSRYERRRRRSTLVLSRQVRDSEATAGDKSEEYSENVNKNESESKRIHEDEERRTDLTSSHLNRSRISMGDQQGAACEDKGDSKPHFLFAERRGRRSGGRRSILELVMQRNQAFQSVEKPAASEQRDTAASEQRPGTSVQRSHLNHQTPHSSSETGQQEAPHVTDNRTGKKSDECRRVLQFGCGDEAEDEDQTAPLTMLAQTPIIMRASVLKNPVDQKQQKETCAPVIKKSLFDDLKTTSRFSRRRSIRIGQQVEDDAGQSHQNEELKASRLTTLVSNTSGNPSSEALPGQRRETESIDFSGNTLENVKVKDCHTPQEGNTSTCTSWSSKKRINFPAHAGSTKKTHRRRSAAVLCVRTPMKRKAMSTEAKSTSKLTGSSKMSSLKGSQKCPRLRRSLVGNRWLSPAAASDSKSLQEENKIQISVTDAKPRVVDASTNTTISLAKIKLVDLKVLEDIENLLKEQEELNAKAAVMQEKTEARRVEMKKRRLMESFMTSISPLRRLKTLFSDNPVDQSDAQESTGHCKAEGEGSESDCAGATWEANAAPDQSMTELVSPKAPLSIKDHQVQWKRHRLDKRLSRTYQEPIVEEEFRDVCQGSTSPFTTLVGDCDRPSLAPMTPHSRHHVSLLKSNLHEQLRILYDE